MFGARFIVMAAMALSAAPALASQQAKPTMGNKAPKKVAPSFDCLKAKKGSIDQVICNSKELSILDRTMGQKYARATLATPRTEFPALQTDQREFIANRNKCMKRKADRHDCFAFAYESRNQRLDEWIDGSAWRGDQ